MNKSVNYFKTVKLILDQGILEGKYEDLEDKVLKSQNLSNLFHLSSV